MTDTQTNRKRDVRAKEALRGKELPDVLRISDVLHLLQISRKTLNNIRAQGGFPPPFYIGSHPRWRRSALEEWMDQGGSKQ